MFKILRYGLTEVKWNGNRAGMFVFKRTKVTEQQAAYWYHSGFVGAIGQSRFKTGCYQWGCSFVQRQQSRHSTCLANWSWIHGLGEQIHGCISPKIHFRSKDEAHHRLCQDFWCCTELKGNYLVNSSWLGYYSKAFAWCNEGRLPTFRHECSETVPYGGKYGAKYSVLFRSLKHRKLDSWWHDGCKPCRPEMVLYDTT